MPYRVTRMFSVLVAGILAAFPVWAQSPLSEADLRTELAGKSFVHSDGGLSHYDISGEYSFAHHSGRVTIGKWTIAKGRVCIDQTNEPQSCFTFARDANGLQVTTSNGDVFQLTPVK